MQIHKTLLLVIPLIACTAPVDAEPTSTSSASVTVNGVEIGEHWRSRLRCDGAHVDVFEGGYSYLKQVVVDDPGAAAYLRAKLDAARANDPFSRNIGQNGVIRPSRADELVLYTIDSSDVHQDFLFSRPVTWGNEIRADVQRFTWEREEQPGLFRRTTDMKVRLVRNGWWEYRCEPGRSGDPDICGNTGNGWSEWEIANWVFRGCRPE